MVVKTIILKIENPDDALENTIVRYTEGMNYVGKVIYENKKPIPINKLQPMVYKHLRESIGLKSQMSCNIVRQVTGTYRTMRKKKEWKEIHYKPTNITFSYRRDYTITKNELSITTNKGRQKYKILNYEYALQYFDDSWNYLASKLVKHKDNDYYFHLSVEMEIKKQEITQASNFIGVDVGINHLAVTTTTDKKNKFFAGGEIKNIRNIYHNQRKRLQKKGTPSAKRMLKHLSGKEKRLMRDVNHNISKQIVEFAVEQEAQVIGLENLNGIRESTKVRKKQRYKHHSWAFRQLQNFVEYKANEKGISVIYIDPRYTSQTCPRCKHTNKNNRKGRNFICKSCNYELNSDLIGARNIEQKTRDFRHDLEFQGLLSLAHTEN